MAERRNFIRYTLHSADGTQIGEPTVIEDCDFTRELKEEEVGEFIHRSPTGRLTITGTIVQGQ